jgi:hypothetical protein
MMRAIEFETDINGEFIQIPHVERLKSKHVRVILLYHEEDNQKQQLPEIFYAPVTRSQYEPFNREDIYSG